MELTPTEERIGALIHSLAVYSYAGFVGFTAGALAGYIWSIL